MEIYILYLRCFIAVCFGLAIHTGIKYNSTAKLAKAAGEEYTFTDFMFKGKVSHIVNIICAASWLLVLPDALQLYPKIELFLTFLSCVLGYGNSSVVIKIFGVGQRYIIDKVDHLSTEAKKK